jgi:hypothetical protein
MVKFILCWLAIFISTSVWSQTHDLDLIDLSDIEALNEDKQQSEKKGYDDGVTVDLSEKEEIDDLGSLKSDLGDILIDEEKNKNDKVDKILKGKSGELTFGEDEVETIETQKKDEKAFLVNDDEAPTVEQTGDKAPLIFDVGDEELELLEVAKFIQSKIPQNEWDEIAEAAQIESYTVQEGEWLWKISKQLFGSGFYYAKIWALNPFITNPHEIEAGMTLVFSTGSSDTPPEVALGSFDDDESVKSIGKDGKVKLGAKLTEGEDKRVKDLSAEITQLLDNFEDFGDDITPPWIREKKRLLKNGVYIQYASNETYKDLTDAAATSLIKEYENYEPPFTKINIPGSQESEYDEGGFDKDAKISFQFKEGFHLNTFVTQNIIQDFGYVTAAKLKGRLSQGDLVYVKFDPGVRVEPDDLFSVYVAGGKVEFDDSDREGYRYTIQGQIRAIRQINDVWEAQIFESSGVINRSDRITVYTPKIDRILKTFNSRIIEAAVIEGHEKRKSLFAFGDVVYIDRGRADGVELGNVFEVYSFMDRLTNKKITPSPTYKIGELLVITLTDNFATALISNSSSDIRVGNVAITKTAEDAARTTKIRSRKNRLEAKRLEEQALEELDVELNMDDLNEELLEKADKIKLTEDELEELERQEREKSILKDHERDLRSLEKLETEIEEAEKILQEARTDEDQILEQQNLDEVERKNKTKKDEYSSVNELEEEFGKKYLDENLNNKDNPYGLTEYDIEEIDELLNTEQAKE